MIRGLLRSAALAGLAIAPLACDAQSGKSVTAKGGSNSNPPASTEVGSQLYVSKPLPPEPAGAAITPIAIPGVLTVTEKVDIPSQRDSKIMMIGTEVVAGEPAWPADKLSQFFDPNLNRTISIRPLVPGDRVEKGRTVVILDDREALAEYLIHIAAKSAAAADVTAAKATLELADLQSKKTQELFKQNQVTQFEVDKNKLEVERAKADLEMKKAAEVKATEEAKKAQVQLDMYHIPTPISGILQPTNRKTGEGIRAQEILFQIQNTDILRAEGTIERANVRLVKSGMDVVIEPSVEMAAMKWFVASAGRINSIAFSRHAEPRIVVASEDKTVKVYSLAGMQLNAFPHPTSVRSVACTQSGNSQIGLTGAEDGIGRLWDLDAKVPTPRILEGAKHNGVISAVAFSPDGKTCVTADNHDIFMWDVGSAKLKYVFPAHHLGEIQSVTFTPQSRLVSAARDNTLAVWTLGDTGARLEYAIPGRSGDVGRIGISHSGRYALFDIAQSLRVTTIPQKQIDSQSIGDLHSMTDAYKFSTLAIYSPDDKLILTGTNADGRLAVWKAPTASSRATELRQFTPSERVTLTCAAISPSEKFPVAVSGTKEGVVYVWSMPNESEIREPIKGKITFVDNSADASGARFRVWADFDNSKAQLPPGAGVTLVVTPAQPVVASVK